MTLHFRAPEKPPSPSFTKTIPSTISKTKGEFTLQFYTPREYNAAAGTGRKFPAVVNFHGGGFTIGNATDDARFARFVLEKCNAVFVSVDYRLAPENPFPVAVEDSADALLYLIRSGSALHIDPLKLAVSGFSAGGNLAIASTLCLTDHLQTLKESGKNTPHHRIRAVATWYPVTDYTQSRAVKRAASVRPDQVLPETLTSLFDASYLHPPTLRLANPYLSPSKATDKHLAAAIPETVIFYTCEWDMLMREGEELAKRLQKPPINKDVRYKMIKGVPHAWDKSPDPTKPAPFSEDLYQECCRYLSEAFEKP
jgi:acetyl esterase/lipase